MTAPPMGARHEPAGQAPSPQSPTDFGSAKSHDRERGPDEGQDLGTKAQHLADTARDAIEQTKASVDSALESGKRTVAGRLQEASEGVHRSADELRPLAGWLADLVDRGAGELANVSSALERQDFADVAARATRLGREQPALFFGGAVIVGLALGRLARASLDSYAQANATGGPSGGHDEPASSGAAWHPSPTAQPYEAGREMTP